MERNSRENQKRIFEFMKGYIAVNQHAPTIREIADFVGYRSVSGVHEALGHLERKGFIRRNKKHAWRGLEIIDQPTVHCPNCNLDLPESQFGVVRARASGRNLYCKWCVLEKVHDGRERKRQMKASRKALQPVQVTELTVKRKSGAVFQSVKTAEEKTREAIASGCQAWDEIQKKNQTRQRRTLSRARGPNA